MDWFVNDGRLEVAGKVLQGPKPQEVAEDYFKALQRLQSFVVKNAPVRPVVVGEIGHQCNGGKVDYYAFQKIRQGQGMAHEAEMVEILIDPYSPEKSVVSYKGKKFSQENESK